MPKVAHAVETAGTAKIIMSLRDGVYDAVIGPIVGITKLTGAVPPGSFTETSVNGVRKGLLGSIRITVLIGAKRRTRKLLVSLEKLDTCVAQLPGKAFASGTILSARFPIRRRLR